MKWPAQSGRTGEQLWLWSEGEAVGRVVGCVPVDSFGEVVRRFPTVEY